MIQSIFDGNCCHNVWDDSLYNKLCFFADDIGRLKSIVDAGEVTVTRRYARPTLTSGGSFMFPFYACPEPDSEAGRVMYSYCYYDPLYEVKLGHRSGVTVLRRVKGCQEMDWVPDSSPVWDSVNYDYRLVTPEDGLVFTHPSSTEGTPNPSSTEATSSQSSGLFDEFCIFRDWTDCLEGLPVFVGDSFASLEGHFLDGEPVHVCPSGDFDFPFFVDEFCSSFRFVYYDPLLEFKRARADGKVIEVLDGGQWLEVPADEKLFLEPNLYRIRPEFVSDSVVSNRELACWLAKGNGEYRLDNDVVSSLYIYTEGTADDPVPSQLRVRQWCALEWSLPTRRYLDLVKEV